MIRNLRFAALSALSLVMFAALPQVPAYARVDLAQMTPTFVEDFSTSLVGGLHPNPAKWNDHYDFGATINGELQAYVPDAFRIANGTLGIFATQRRFLDKAFTSGALTTSGHFAQAYGYFVINAKIPSGKALWPTFWLLPVDKHNDPQEIDIMENLGQDPGLIYTTYHHARLQDGRTYEQGKIRLPDMSKGFHRYGLEWRPGLLVWYIDDKEVFRVTGAHVPSTPMYMLANLALGSQDQHWAGSPDATTRLPASFDIDYIRAYQFKNSVPAPVLPLSFNAITITPQVVKPGDTITVSGSLRVGNSWLPDAQIRLSINDFACTRWIGGAPDQTLRLGAKTAVPFRFTYKVPTDMPEGIYSAQTGLHSNQFADTQYRLAGRFTVKR